MAQSNEQSSVSPAATTGQARDFLLWRPLAPADAPEPQPWTPISRAECWLLAIRLHRAFERATGSEGAA